jgi:putative colanic acid biosynthesis glycosyltransferase WcaI
VRVLLLSQHFAPEVTAASLRLVPLAEGLVARGHEVEVVCEVPNHPEGIVRDGYRGHLFLRHALNGFSTLNVWVYASPAKTPRSRMLLYGSFALNGMLAGIVARRPDVILVSSPPLPSAAAGAVVARLRRVRWVMDVRDPWPEAAVALGELSGVRMIAALERLERRLYASAAAIITVTQPFADGIRTKVAQPEKVTVIPNGTTDAWLEAGERDEDRAALGMPEDRFVLTYAGNVGLAQGMEAVVAAAGLLDDGFQLQVVGSGPRLASIREQASKLPPGRVVFRGVVAPEHAARLLRASDASVVPLGTALERQRSVPVKLFDCCAIGRPVIVSAAGEATKLASDADAALCVSPDDAVALADAVRRLREDGALRSRLAKNGRAFAKRHRREDGIDRFEQVLTRAARRSR